MLNATSEKSYGKLLCSWLIMHVNLKHIYSWPYWYSLTQYIGTNILFFMLWTKDIVLLPATKLAYNKKHFAYFGFKHLVHVLRNLLWFYKSYYFSYYRKEIIRLDIATTDRLSNLVCDEASKCYLHTVLEMYFLHYNETKYAAWNNVICFVLAQISKPNFTHMCN